MITQAYIYVSFVSNGLYVGQNVLNNVNRLSFQVLELLKTVHGKAKFWSEWGMLVVHLLLFVFLEGQCLCTRF